MNEKNLNKEQESKFLVAKSRMNQIISKGYELLRLSAKSQKEYKFRKE